MRLIDADTLTKAFEGCLRLEEDTIIRTIKCAPTINTVAKIESLQTELKSCENCIHNKNCKQVIILKNGRFKQLKFCSQFAERKKHDFNGRRANR